MASRLVALVEHPALEGDNVGVDVSTRRRIGATEDDAKGRKAGRAAEAQPRARGRRAPEAEPLPLDLDRIVEEESTEPDPIDLLKAAERRRERDEGG